MIATIVRKEVLEFRRDRLFLALAAVVIVLLVAASLDGWNRGSADRAARLAAEVTDRRVWVEQGENNPHGAAHFARYAFRQTPALAAFDPGVFDYAGAAFWMEAHTQNPTTLRRTEDAAVQAPFATLTPAWIIQIVGTLALAVLLFPAVAGERERGTLRALSTAGVDPRTIALGKAGAVLVFVGTMTLLVIAAPLLPALFTGEAARESGRLLALIACYGAALLAFAALILGVSACNRSVGGAFAAAAVCWLFMALLWPILAGQLAVSLYPDIDEQELKNDIQLQAQTPFWVGDAQEDAVAALEAEVLAEFGAENFESLGFDREGLVLQAHEVFSGKVYDRLYGELYGTHRRQDEVLRYASAFSPLLALSRLSAGFAGTDLLAQQTFAEQSERHRRMIIAQLNRDMMVNAGDEAFAYMADRSLWESIADFRARPPSLRSTLSYYWFELAVLLLWLGGAAFFALRATSRALLAEAR
ncbi:MAG: ABC transporter permease subunit [Pseudomonadota bacterium]